MKKDELKRIKNANDIVEVGRELGIQIGDNGRARCFYPELHKNGDAHPSLEFDRQRGRAKCWACKKVDTDVVGIVQAIKKCGFPEAVRFLAARKKLPAPEFRASVPDDRKKEIVERGNVLTRFAQEAEARMGGVGLRYLTDDRGLSEKVIKLLHLGFVDDVDAVCDAIRQNRDKAFTLDAAGLRSLLLYARHKLSAVIFPYIAEIEDPDGNKRRLAVSLKARVIGDAAQLGVPKYVGSQGEVFALYNGLALAAYTTVYVAEGELDTLTLLSHDLPAVGVPGATAFKDAWAEQFIDKQVFIVLDADLAGQRGALDITRKLRAYARSIKRVELPYGADVNSFFNKGRKHHAA